MSGACALQQQQQRLIIIIIIAGVAERDLAQTSKQQSIVFFSLLSKALLKAAIKMLNKL